MNPTNLFAIGLGVFVALPGVLDVAGVFRSHRRIERLAGDEFLVDAHVATFSVANQAIGIQQNKFFTTFLLFVSTLGVLIAIATGTALHAPIIGICVGMAGQRMARQMLPGCILLLGRSEDTCIGLQLKINGALKPFRAISLLRVNSRAIARNVELRPDSFRLKESGDWVGAVRVLSALMPILVLDMRGTSEYVDEEIRIIREDKHAYKTLLVAPEGHNLSTVGLGELVRANNDEECVQILRNVVSGPAPTLDRPLTQIMRA